MFSIGWGEFLIIGVVALLVIGPKELPAVLRSIGQWTTKLRRMASEFQGQFQEAMREAEVADLKKEVDEMTAHAKSYTEFDPIGDVRKELDSTHQQLESALTGNPIAAATTPATVEASSAPAASVETTPSGSEPAVAAKVDAPFNVDAPVATPTPLDTPPAAPLATPAPPELETAGAAAAPAKPDAGGKPA
jgi:sec-independent protein translocase protein TatB